MIFLWGSPLFVYSRRCVLGGARSLRIMFPALQEMLRLPPLGSQPNTRRYPPPTEQLWSVVTTKPRACPAFTELVDQGRSKSKHLIPQSCRPCLRWLVPGWYIDEESSRTPYFQKKHHFLQWQVKDVYRGASVFDLKYRGLSFFKSCVFPDLTKFASVRLVGGRKLPGMPDILPIVTILHGEVKRTVAEFLTPHHTQHMNHGL